MAHVLVTGAAGFIGAAVTAALAASGDRVTGIDVAVGPALARLAVAHRAVTARVCEITEWAALSEVIRCDVPDAVVHCTAVVGVPASVLSPHRTFEVNLGAPHDAYNLGSGRAATLAEIVAIIRELVPGADISAGPGAFEHSLPGASVPAVRKGALNVERAGAAFGYRPRFGIRAGLAAYVEAVRAQH